MRQFLSKNVDYLFLFVRLSAAFAFLFHGMAKWVLWEQPEQMSGLMQMLSIAEPLCALGLAFGFFTRSAALMGGILMCITLVTKTLFWGVEFVNEVGTGWEIDLLLFTHCAIIVFFGPGEFSVDSFMPQPSRSRPASDS